VPLEMIKVGLQWGKGRGGGAGVGVGGGGAFG